MEPVERVSDAGAGPPARGLALELATLRDRIERACAEVGREPSEIRVLAVTKGFGPEAIEAAIAANIPDVGENYLQEAQAKFADVAWPAAPKAVKPRRHFIGRVQRNKARKIAALFDVVQTIDGPAVATALARGAADAGKTLDVLIQVNIAHDDRNGVPVDDVPALARNVASLDGLRLRGVMAVGPLDSAQSLTAFERAAGAYRILAREHTGLDTLSMGMTSDLEAAITAGTTMVRVGTALFGPRPGKG